MSKQIESKTRTANILLVEDSPVQAEVIRRLLADAGHSVSIAETGFEALGRVAAREFDLVLLDLTLPGMSGSEVLDAIRGQHSPQKLPIIIVTTKVDSEEVVSALARGANDYVTKPLDGPVFLARIQAQLRMSSSGAEQENFGLMTTTLYADSATVEMSLTVADAADWIGRVLGNKYRLDEVIGSGGFGVVYRATHVAMNKAVAIKMLSTNPTAPKAKLNELQHEAIAACRIEHPNAVQVFDVDLVSDSVPFIVMELLKGNSLAQELIDNNVRLPHRCAEVLLPICGALAQSHAVGVIHRDIKPGNIFLHNTKQGEVVKVLDFGTAKIGEIFQTEDSSARNTRGNIRITPEYVAPERLRNESYDGKVDVYSLGVILYEMLTGRLPFETDSGEYDHMAIALKHLTETPGSIRDLNADLSPELDSCVSQALEKDPQARCDLTAFAAQLTRATMD